MPSEYTKEIIYCRETADYEMRLDGELVGFARTYQEAEFTLDTLVFELLSSAIPAPDAVVAHRQTQADSADIVAAVAAGEVQR